MSQIKLTPKEKLGLTDIGITIQTVNNWIAGRSFPTPHHRKILTQLTGRDYTKMKRRRR